MHSFTTMLVHAPIVATKEMKRMTNGTWRQRMINRFLRRKPPNPLDGFAEIDEGYSISELDKKISKDRANLKGLGEEE